MQPHLHFEGRSFGRRFLPGVASIDREAISGVGDNRAAALYFAGSGFALWLAWQLACLVGYFAGKMSTEVKNINLNVYKNCLNYLLFFCEIH